MGQTEAEEDREKRELEAARKLAGTETLRAEEGALANQRLRWLVGLLAIILFAAIGATAFAINESRRAETQARLAFARELTLSATSTLDNDPELSMHLALQAVLTTYEEDGTILPPAEEALHQALQQNRVLSSFPQGGGLAFSPDGSRLATGGDDGSIVIWDVRTGEEVDRIDGHSTQVTSLDFSADGLLLASADETYRRMVWDLEAGRPVLKLPASSEAGPVLGANKVAFSNNNNYLLTTSSSEELEIWDVSTGYKVAHVDDSAGPDGAFSPNGSQMAITTAVWNVASIPPRTAASLPHVLTWEDRQFDLADAILEIQAPSSSNLSVYQDTGSVEFSPDGERLLTTAISNLAVMADAHTGEMLFPLRGHSGVVHSIAFSPDGSQAATGSADGTARIWDAQTGEELLTLVGHQDEVVRVVFNPEGELLATSSLDGSSKIWELGLGSQGELPGPHAHSGDAIVKFSPLGPFLASAGSDGELFVTNILTGNTRFQLNDESDGIQSLAYSQDGAVLALGTENGNVQVVEGRNGQVLTDFEVGGSPVSLAFNPGADLLAVGSSDGELSIWDTGTWRRIRAWPVSSGFVNGLAFSPDGEQLAAVSFTGEGLVLDVNDLQSTSSGGDGPLPQSTITAELKGPIGPFTSLDWSPDGGQLVTTSWDGQAVLWDRQTGEPELDLVGHRGQVRAAAYSPDGGRIVSAGSDGAILVWDAETGDLLFGLDMLDGAISSLAFSEGGDYLAVGGEDGSVQVYLMPVDDLIDLARNRLTRDLTEGECQRYLHLDECP